jgi:hypothetical protein
MTGQYLIVPASSTEAISAQMDSIKMLSGYLVPKTIANNADPMTVAQSALPGVTYATLKVSVQPAADVALQSAPKGSEAAGSGGKSDGSVEKKPAPKKKPG